MYLWVAMVTTVLYFESPDYALVECAREPGFLSLTPSSRQRFNITVLRVYVGEPEGVAAVFVNKYFIYMYIKLSKKVY